MSNLRLPDADPSEYINDLLRRGFQEIIVPRDKPLVFGAYNQPADLIDAQLPNLIRRFGKTYVGLLTEIQHINIKTPSYSFRWMKFHVGAEKRLLKIAKALRQNIKERHRSHVRFMRKLQKCIGSHLEIEKCHAEFHPISKRNSDNTSRILSSIKPFLDAIRINHMGEHYYPLHLNISPSGFQAYTTLLWALKEVENRSAMDSRGGYRPGVGRPRLPKNKLKKYKIKARKYQLMKAVRLAWAIPRDGDEYDYEARVEAVTSRFHLTDNQFVLLLDYLVEHTGQNHAKMVDRLFNLPAQTS